MTKTAFWNILKTEGLKIPVKDVKKYKDHGEAPFHTGLEV